MGELLGQGGRRMPRPRRGFPAIILPLALCLLALSTSANPAQAEAAAQIRIYGRVVDYYTGQPLAEAQVIFMRGWGGIGGVGSLRRP